MVSAVLLAAGESRRMGESNKLLLPFRGQSFIAHITAQLLASEIEELLVVTGHEPEAIQQALAGQSVRLVHNPDYVQGMTTSIRTGVQAADPKADGLMICLSDLPFIEASDYTELIRRFQQMDRQEAPVIVRPVYEQQPGNPVLFSSFFREEILAHEKMEGCRGLIKQHRDRVRLVPMPNDHTLRDIDTPDEYERYRSQL